MAMHTLTRHAKGLGRQRDNIDGMLLDMLQNKLPNLCTSFARAEHRDPLIQQRYA
jgi:hypothetical protein